MTDLQVLLNIKASPFLSNSLFAEREIFDTSEACIYDFQIENDVFCFYKNTKYNFKNMYFYANKSALLSKNKIVWNQPYFVTEIISLENNIEQNNQIKNWLISQGNYHYHTIFRLYRLASTIETDENFSIVQNPTEDDFEIIVQILEQNFNKYTERIPTVEEIRKWQKSIYLVKEENQIAAILVSELKGTTNELHFWLVDSKFRGKGYGDLVFKYCFNCNKDIKRYTSWIDVNHEYSIKKHLEYGFVKDRIINSIYLNNNIMKEKIIQILEDTRPEFDFKDESINFIDAGYLDSFDIITLVVDLETTFEVKIIGALIVPESFESVDAILKLIETSKNAS